MVGRPDATIDFGKITLNSSSATTGVAATNILDLKDQKVSGYKVMIRCSETVTGSGSETVNIKVQDSADNSTFADLVATGAVAKATLVKGYVQELYIPKGHKRYLKVLAIPSAATMTAGGFRCEIDTGR